MDVKFLSHRKMNAFGPRLFFDVVDDDDGGGIVKKWSNDEVEKEW